MALRCRLHLRWAAVCALAIVGACRSAAEAREDIARVEARRLHVIQGFGFPESVRYDPAQDVYFVSNMAGPGSLKDGNGYIARVSAADPSRAEVFIQGGSGGVVLDAPKGMAIHGDTLWVTDIDVLRGFHRVTGAPLATVDLRPNRAVLLNDVAVGPDGSLHLTDTGIAMTNKGVVHLGGDRIFRVGPGRSVSVVAQSRRSSGRTGSPGTRTRSSGSSSPSIRSTARCTRCGRARRGSGCWGAGWGGSTAWSAWATAGSWSPRGATRPCTSSPADGARRSSATSGSPADLGVDTRRQRVAIPLVLQGRVEIWQLPAE